MAMPAAVIDIELFPVTDRIEFLREYMLTAPVPLVLEPHIAADIVVHSRVADVGRLHLLSTRAKGGDVVRTARLASDGTPPSLMVSIVDQGTALVRQGDRTTTLNSGDIGMYLTTDPYRIRFSDGARRHTFQVRLDDLHLPIQLIRNQLATTIHPDHPTTAAVSAFLGATARNAPSADADELARLGEPTLALVRLLLTRSVTDSPVGREAANASLTTRIEEYVKAQLDDPGLSARSIGAAFSISERYVYTILRRRGIDLGDAIRQRRLERARQLLEDPRRANSTISAIAHQCGFPDHAHFSRVFRARFGMAPSDWRQGAVVDDRGTGADGATLRG